jgi:nucleoside-diphosphate-sugar epimerase
MMRDKKVIVTGGLDLVKIFQGHDYVFHEAAIASVPRSIVDPAGSDDVIMNISKIIIDH